jgi:hypothetical protein
MTRNDLISLLVEAKMASDDKDKWRRRRRIALGIGAGAVAASLGAYYGTRSMRRRSIRNRVKNNIAQSRRPREVGRIPLAVKVPSRRVGVWANERGMLVSPAFFKSVHRHVMKSKTEYPQYYGGKPDHVTVAKISHDGPRSYIKGDTKSRRSYLRPGH